jgi:hypothetical protein
MRRKRSSDADTQRHCAVRCGLFTIYIGCRFVVARKIPVVSEDDSETYGWLRGKEAVIAGLAVVALGLALLAAAIGLIRLHA